MGFDKVKTAIVGCGMISDIYMKTLSTRFQIIDLVACCDIDVNRANQVAEKYSIKAMTLEEIIADKSIEIVVNLTRMQYHYDLNKQLLEAGKNVYTEKVLATKLEEAKVLDKIAKDKNLYLGSAPDTFLGSAIQTARFVVESGLIGEVSSFTANINRDFECFLNNNTANYVENTGMGYDVGIYYITALLSILGEVKSVNGIKRTRNTTRTCKTTLNGDDEKVEIACETIMSGTLEFGNGTIGNILFDADSIFIVPEQPIVVLYGTKGILYMSDPNNFGGEVRVLLKGSNEPFVMQQSYPFAEDSRGLGVAEMAWAMRQKRQHRVSKELAIHSLEVLEGIGVSSASRKFYDMTTKFEKTKPFERSYNDFFNNFSPDLSESLLTKY